ncbi:1,4-dihydroxy-6-naphthoate synthase [Niastella yeongjuensis]|uniref:1,4-dihydroxy-6-naphtoate synthase n=1 Tax=Niastella yeongjuensis TaxID=354355 RepID=A0A1V9EYW4_9BACT|nr:1,4-dihydroxy-6-naphthoate synthase [Niastella yeongjuensis]OQP51302.1 1,4-dihydroxy-6-naphthoate synthase [Niastella yeongjuensis]SEP39097.1 1,4-dihydroxy-6-naphthoate synthase [Niastella yeongjuensis]
MTLTLGFSPCPNDTFIFDALVNNKIDTQGITVQPVLEDVQTLNEWAIQGRLDVTKISYGVLPLLLEKYIVLNAGGALGKGVGPLLITKQASANTKNVNDMSIAIPGENTTAHMLFSLAYPQATNKKFMVFSAIEDAVLNGDVDAGVIIHENRFTYQQKGLHKLVDLGEYWERVTGNPIPLGGIVMKKSFDSALQQQVDGLIKRSLEYSFANYPLITDYVKQHSQEMSEAVMRQHIDLYVNNYSLQLGPDGKAAVNTFMDIYGQLKKVGANDKEIFLATAE